MRMQRLPGKVYGTEIVGTIDIPLLADQRVTPKPRLQPDLVPFPVWSRTSTSDASETLDHAILADGVFAARISRMGLLLDESRRSHMSRSRQVPEAARDAINDCEIETLGLVSA